MKIIFLLLFFLLFYPPHLFNQEEEQTAGQIIIPIDPPLPTDDTHKNVKPPDNGAKLLANIKNKIYSGDTININFKNADVNDIIRIFSKISDIPIIADPGIDDSMSCIAKNIPWDQAFDFFLKENRLLISLQGNSLFIYKIPTDFMPDSFFQRFYRAIFSILLILLLIISAVYFVYHLQHPMNT